MTEIQTNAIPIIDQQTEERYEKLAIRRLIRKIDRRIIPFMFILETSSYMNRTNIGHAKLMGIETDLHASASEINWAVSVFFLAFLVFAVPSNILMRYIGPSRYLSLDMLTWGAITIGMAFVTNAKELITTRLLLGIFQAGFFTSMIIYISLWYRKQDHTMRIAILYGAAILSAALGSVLAYGFRQMDGIRNLNGWQWMFLLEGIPMIPLGIITSIFLSDIPDTIQWLTALEKQLLINILRRDTGIDQCKNDDRFSCRQVYYVFTDWKVYLGTLMNIVTAGVTKYLTTYLPIYVKHMFNSNAYVHLMTAPPYVFAFLACLLINYSAARKREHLFHIIFSLFIALIGFILMIILIHRGTVPFYISICITCCGIFPALPLVLSWLTVNIDGCTKKAIALGFVIGTGQLFGIILPLIHHDEPTDRRSSFICLGIVAFGLLLTIGLRIGLWLEKRRSIASDHEATITE